MKFGKIIKTSLLILIAGLLVVEIVFCDFLRLRDTQAIVLGLPEPTKMIAVSADYSYPVLKGLKLDPDNPLNIEFYVDTKNKSNLTQEESQDLINYFLTGLVVPAKDWWVNLSPYEQNRIIPDSLGNTDAGKDLLAQDYILKQLSSSLSSPETKLGKEYWDSIVGEQSLISNKRLNKVWVVPEKIRVFESGNSVFITESSLDVKSEHVNSATDLLIPEIKNDVNNGKNFSKLRQVYSSLIIAAWFKNKFKESFYKNYINSNDVSGFELEDKSLKDKIYALYCESFEKGVYKLLKKNSNNKLRQSRQYFSGGAKMQLISSSIEVMSRSKNPKLRQYVDGDFVRLVVSANRFRSESKEKWPEEPAYNNSIGNWLSYLSLVRNTMTNAMPKIEVLAYDQYDNQNIVRWGDWIVHGLDVVRAFKLIDEWDNGNSEMVDAFLQSQRKFNQGMLAIKMIIEEIENYRIPIINDQMQTRLDNNEPLEYQEVGSYLMNKLYSNNQNRESLYTLKEGFRRLKTVQQALNAKAEDVISSSVEDNSTIDVEALYRSLYEWQLNKDLKMDGEDNFDADKELFKQETARWKEALGDDLIANAQILLVVGPSGAGKSELIEAINDRTDNIEQVKLVTTRPMRSGEVNGREKFFISIEEFKDKKSKGQMFFDRRSHGEYYGADVEWFRERVNAGKVMVFDITTPKSFIMIKELFPNSKTIMLSHVALDKMDNISDDDIAAFYKMRFAERNMRATEEMKRISENIFNTRWYAKNRELFELKLINPETGPVKRNKHIDLFASTFVSSFNKYFDQSVQTRLSSSIDTLSAEDLKGLKFELLEGASKSSLVTCLIHRSYPGLIFKIMNDDKLDDFDKIVAGAELAALAPEYTTKTKIIRNVDCVVGLKKVIVDMVVQQEIILTRDLVADSVLLNDAGGGIFIIDSLWETEKGLWSKGIFNNDFNLMFNYGYNPKTKKMELFDFDQITSKPSLETPRESRNHNDFKLWATLSQFNSVHFDDELGDYYDENEPTFEEFKEIWGSKPVTAGGVDFEEMNIEIASSSVSVSLPEIDLLELDKFSFVIQSMSEVDDIAVVFDF